MIDWVQYLPHIKSVFEILLLGLAVITTLFCAVTIRNLFRQEHLIMSWKSGSIAGFPLGASILSIVSFIILVAGFTLPSDAEVWMLLVYGWSTVCWLAASYLTSKYYITESGIIQDINDESRFLEWSRIIDFVEREKEGRYVRFTFFYLTNIYNNRSDKLKRVEIKVPENRAELFQSILDLKMEKDADIKLIPEKRFELPN